MTQGGAGKIRVFVRDGCHLCDSLLEELHEFCRRRDAGDSLEVEVLDIEDREAWLNHYENHVPVVVVNGQEICHYFLDTNELEDALSCP